MKKKSNKGTSMVEILIALAIFMIMMIPIVKGIVFSLNRTSDAKTLQYRNEFAEAVMEHIKAVDINEIKDTTYYESLGSTGVTVTANAPVEHNAEYDANHDGDSKNDKLISNSYSIKGKIELGTTSKQYYDYEVVVDDSYYVENKAKDESFVDPNNLALGVVEDIDYNKVAIISDTVLNYDSVASDAFVAKKLQLLKQINKKKYEQQISQELGDSLFISDTASRLMTIEVSGDATKGYTVRCILSYIDNNEQLEAEAAAVNKTVDDTLYVEYIPYGHTFESKLPNIYIMYNPCYYGSSYSKHDYIAVDTTNLDDSEVNVFMIETAAEYSADIKNTEREKKNKDSNYSSTVTKALDKGGRLINEVTNNLSRSDVDVHVVCFPKSGNTDKIHFYHNFLDYTDSKNVAKDNKTSDISHLFYGEAEKSSMMINKFLNELNVSASPKKTADIISSIEYLSYAEGTSRGLYQVRVYMKEGTKTSTPAFNTSTSSDDRDIPILQGTKGGNETK